MLRNNLLRAFSISLLGSYTNCSHKKKNFPDNIISKVETIPENIYHQKKIALIIRQKGSNSMSKEPEYSQDEISLKNGLDGNRCWVTYRDGVYDISDYLNKHPGGKSFIMKAAGGSVDDFWEYWGVHHYSADVSGQLQKRRIGRFSDYDYSQNKIENNMYLNEEERHPNLKKYVNQPFEAESCYQELASKEFTDPSLFFVRNHAPVPYVEKPDKHQIIFLDELGTQKCFQTVDELISKFGIKEVPSVLQCSGNRARESIQNNKLSKMAGKPSEIVGYGLMGNSKWSGIPLESVLYHVYPELVNMRMSEIEKKHLVLHGSDDYVSSVPLQKILGDSQRKNNCLLATQMDRKPLNLDHGFPVRALFPGIVGARSVKWLSKIEISNQESQSPWNKYFYKNGNKPCMEIPLNSLITFAKVKKSTLFIKGVAYGDGELINKVEISFDKGQHWNKVNITNQPKSLYSWVRWEYQAHTHDLFKDEQKCVEIMCRATSNNRKQNKLNGSLNQIESDGYLYDGWHQIKVHK